MKFVPLTLVFIEFLNQTLPRLLDAPSLENVHSKSVSCGARHTAVIAGMLVEHLWIFQICFSFFPSYKANVESCDDSNLYMFCLLVVYSFINKAVIGWLFALCCLKMMEKCSAGDGTSMARYFTLYWSISSFEGRSTPSDTRSFHFSVFITNDVISMVFWSRFI